MRKEEIKPLVWEEQKRTVTLTNEQWVQLSVCISEQLEIIRKRIEDMEERAESCKYADIKEECKKSAEYWTGVYKALESAGKSIEAIR